MNLDNYINNLKNKPKNEHSKIYFSQFDIDSFDNISDEKKELIRQLYHYLDEDLFRDIFDRYYNDLKEYAYYQSCTDEGVRGLVGVSTCELVGSYDMPVRVSQERFDKQYNKGLKVGSQKYTTVSYMTHYDSNDGFHSYITIFYFSDGNVFISYNTAYELEKMSVDELGNALASICLQLEKEQEMNKKNKVRKIR